MTDRLHFTDSDEANELIARDPMALLIGFALDQQERVQKAFYGPLALRERLGSLDAAAVAAADLDPLFRERPAIHRFPAVSPPPPRPPPAEEGGATPRSSPIVWSFTSATLRACGRTRRPPRRC